MNIKKSFGQFLVKLPYVWFFNDVSDEVKSIIYVSLGGRNFDLMEVKGCINVGAAVDFHRRSMQRKGHIGLWLQSKFPKVFNIDCFHGASIATVQACILGRYFDLFSCDVRNDLDKRPMTLSERWNDKKHRLACRLQNKFPNRVYKRSRLVDDVLYTRLYVAVGSGNFKLFSFSTSFDKF